jgi:hypothetical protein
LCAFPNDFYRSVHFISGSRNRLCRASLAEAEARADEEALLNAQRRRELLDKIRERIASGYYRKLAEADQNQSDPDSSR